MDELHSFGWYAARIKPHLPEKAFKPAPSRLITGFVLLAIVGTGMFAIIAFDLSIVLRICISFVMGFLLAGIGFLGHEVLHGTVVRNRRLQSWLGGLFFFTLCTGPELWRKWHNLTHHVHTQDEFDDPDAWSTLEFLFTRPIFNKMYRLKRYIRIPFYALFLTINFTFVTWLRFIPYLKGTERVKRTTVLWQFIVPWTFWIALIGVIGWYDWLFVFFIPLLVTNVVVSSYIATNHNLNPMVSVNDPLANSLTVTVPKWVDVIHFNFSYHVEHHIFPGVNPKYYPLVKQHIKAMWPDRYFEMPFWRAMLALFSTPRVYYERTQFIDPATKEVYPTLGHGLEKQFMNK